MKGYKSKQQLGNRLRRSTMQRTSFATIHVRPRPGRPSQGWLRAGSWCVPVALGRGGIRANKREGDGGTPRGLLPAVALWWRPDRLLAAANHAADPPDRPRRRMVRGSTTGATIVRFGGRPMNQAIGSGAKIASTTSLSRSITTRGHESPAAAARSSSMSRGLGFRPDRRSASRLSRSDLRLRMLVRSSVRRRKSSFITS